MLGSGPQQTGAGIGLGVLVALAVTQTLRQLLEGIQATDALTFGGVVVLTAVVGLLASVIPAYRAASAQPAAVLRSG